MAIEIVKEKASKGGRKPYYKLVYNYMIGDANGDTKEEAIVSVDNPFVERYVKLLNSLKPTPGHWGVILEPYRIHEHFEDKQITEDDYKFLVSTMFEDWEDEDEEDQESYFKTEEDKEFASAFCEGVRSEASYSFLVFEGIDLYYYDEFGKKHSTKIK